MQEEMGLNFKSSLDVIYRRRKLIIIIILFSVMVGGSITVISTRYFKKPVIFEGQVSVVIGSTKYGTGDFLIYQQLSGTYTEIANSKKVIEKLAEEFEDYQYGQLKRMTRAYPKGGTHMFMISVKAFSSEDASKIANRYAEIFIEECKNMLPISQLNILDQEVLANNPLAPSLKKNIVIAVAIGIILSIGLCLLLECLDTKLKDEEDLQELIGIPVLASIPFDKRLVVK